MIETRATVLENIRIAENIYSLTFATEQPVPVRPGQFCMLGVTGFPLRRPLAICMAEGERITVCYQVKGRGTEMLARGYQRGHTIPVLLPLGNGFFVRQEEKKVAVVGGGVGVFPLVSVIRAYAQEKEIFSYVGFRTRAAVCMQYELQRSKELTVTTDDGSFGKRGTAVQALMENIGRVKPDVILSCGPLPMLRALKNAVGGKIPAFVSLEERMGCGVGACLVCVCSLSGGAHARVCKDGPVFDLTEVDLNG